MTNNVNWGTQQSYTYVITSASSGSGDAGIGTAVDWGPYYATYQSSQIQQQWSREFTLQPISEEARRIMDGWDPDKNE